MKTKCIKVATLATTLITFGSLAGRANGALVIDFGIGTYIDSDPAVVSGFNFYYTNGGVGAVADVESLRSEIGNGTSFITTRDINDGEPSISMTPVNGGTFSLLSFDAADFNLGVSGRTVEVVGFSRNGVTVRQSFSLVADTFTTFHLPPTFTNLILVEFNNSGAGGVGFSLDNVEVIPEPSSALLFGLGALGFVARRKRTA